MKLNTIIAAAVLAASSQVAIAGDMWLDIAESDDVSVSVKLASAHFHKDVRAVDMIFKYESKHTGRAELHRGGVTRLHCYERAGTLSLMNLSRTTVNEVDFAFGAGTVGSAVAEVLCKIGDGEDWKD